MFLYVIQKQPGLLYRWIGENVWISVAIQDMVWKVFIASPLKYVPPNVRAKYTVWETFKPVAEVLVKAFFIDGLTGAELFNFYQTYTNPLMAKKIRVIKS